ncbi:malonic semialdehyde reductase [Niveibacterium sp. SC-1]|uniref:malonic semialdehyde reductase n=1 Tax=Niveibacterium sp. SC-1 TaxID=3135646 RepID=UPI00311D62CB
MSARPQLSSGPGQRADAGALSAAALDQIFREARTFNAFTHAPVSDETLTRAYELAALGPTGFNAQPARFVFVRTPEAKALLAPALSSGNRDKTLAAPVNLIVAWDTRFHDHLPQLFPAYDARSFFEKSPEHIPSAGISNATLQAAYFFIAARSLGLDVGPMSGFKADVLDAVFFPDGRYRSLFVANLGYGDRASLKARLPRLTADQTLSFR